MDHNRKIYLQIVANEKGQSSTEYILLFAVIVVLTFTLFKSDAFLRIFGSEGIFAKTYKEEVEYSYRHTVSGRKSFSTPNYNNPNHDSYRKSGETRFFGARDRYPNN